MNHSNISPKDMEIRSRHWRLARELVDDAGMRTTVVLIAQIAQERAQDAIRKGGDGLHTHQIRRIAGDLRTLVKNEDLE